MDVDMDCFFLDRENRLPISGDACAHDHDLVRRELNYGQVVAGFTSSDAPAALFGPDDTQHDAQLRGHEIGYTLRPGEKAVFRWDNVGKYCAENAERAHRPKYFGNSKFVYRPRLTLEAPPAETASLVDVIESTAAGRQACLAGQTAGAHVDYAIQVPYAICDGTVRAKFAGLEPDDEFSIALSLDGKAFSPLWSARGTGLPDAEVPLAEGLDVLNP